MILNDELIDELLSGSELSHAMVSLYTDRFDPTDPEGTGFWADGPSTSDLGRWGSGLRKFQRAKTNAPTLLELEGEMLSSLKWMMDDKIVTRIAVQVEAAGVKGKAIVELNSRKVTLDAI